MEKYSNPFLSVCFMDFSPLPHSLSLHDSHFFFPWCLYISPSFHLFPLELLLLDKNNITEDGAAPQEGSQSPKQPGEPPRQTSSFSTLSLSSSPSQPYKGRSEAASHPSSFTVLPPELRTGTEKIVILIAYTQRWTKLDLGPRKR